MRRPRLSRHAVALAALVVIAAISAAGCGRVVFNGENNITIGSAPYTEGSGKIVTVTRSLADFTSISADSGVTVSVRHGSASKADVTSDDNLTGLIATDVSGDTLKITVTGSLTTHHRVEVAVTSAKEIASIAVDNGSTLDTEDLTAAELRVSVGNGSTLRAGGKTSTLHVDVNNGSTGDLTNVEATTADVLVGNGSTAIVNVSGGVTGRCHTGSTLHVKGAAGTGGVDKDSSSTVKRG